MYNVLHLCTLYALSTAQCEAVRWMGDVKDSAY